MNSLAYELATKRLCTENICYTTSTPSLHIGVFSVVLQHCGIYRSFSSSIRRLVLQQHKSPTPRPAFATTYMAIQVIVMTMSIPFISAASHL